MSWSPSSWIEKKSSMTVWIGCTIGPDVCVPAANCSTVAFLLRLGFCCRSIWRLWAECSLLGRAQWRGSSHQKDTQLRPTVQPETYPFLWVKSTARTTEAPTQHIWPLPLLARPPGTVFRTLSAIRGTRASNALGMGSGDAPYKSTHWHWHWFCKTACRSTTYLFKTKKNHELTQKITDYKHEQSSMLCIIP